MTIDEAIERLEESAFSYVYASRKFECVDNIKELEREASEHIQVAEWLKELKERRAKDEPNSSEIPTEDYCGSCNHKGCEICISNSQNPYCVPSNYEPQTESVKSNLEPFRVADRKTEPQTYITEDRDTQILDAWQVHHRNTTSVEDEPQEAWKEPFETDCSWK